LYQVLPPLTGRYPHIGHESFVVAGPHREIGVEVFAPTRGSYENKLRMQLSPERSFMSALSEEQIQTLHTHSVDSLTPIGKLPVLLFSHGWGVNPSEYRPLLEELASHGYMVVSLNHPSSSRDAPFSQNPPVLDACDEAGCEDPAKFSSELDRLTLIQADNIAFITDYIRKKEGDATPIVLAGHSLGGAASIIAARHDLKIKGCINLDGGLRGENKSEGLKTSLLMILVDRLTNMTLEDKEWVVPLMKEWTDLHENSKRIGDSYLGQIQGISHMDFSTGPLLDWLVGEKTLDGAIKAHVVASRAMVQFMNMACRSRGP
jgi:dienelactone hydrolase